MSHRDLVTRLRAMATGGWSHLPNAKTAGEAADVIERLRAELLRAHLWINERADIEAGDLRQMRRLRELLTAVAESGVEWLGRDYVLIQVDRATWSAITAKPAPSPAPAVSGFDFPPEVS